MIELNKPPIQAIFSKQLVLEEQLIPNGVVIIEDGKISAVGNRENVSVPPVARILDVEDKTIAPGLIDAHIHGYNGKEVGTSVEDMLAIAGEIVQNGITSFLPTVGFAPTLPELLCLLERTADAVETNQLGAQMLGINMEAPFISRVGKGPYDRYPPAGLSAGKMARDPSIQELHKMAKAARGHIRTMIIAPELDGALDVIREMRLLDILPSAGHTAASYDQLVESIGAGLKMATHLYNGMRRQDHREPGVIEALLSRDEIVAEIIGDCIHVLPPAVEIAIRCKGIDRLVLITDNTRYAGMPNGTYKDDMNRDVVKDDEKAYIPGWTLAGSVSPLNRNVWNIVQKLRRTLPEAFRLASLNPARLFSVDDRKGSLEVSKDADLIIIDDQIRVYGTMIKGEWVFQEDQFRAKHRLA